MKDCNLYISKLFKTFSFVLMPSKRSTSKEREKKRKYREKRSAEILQKDRDKAKEGMKRLREKKSEELPAKKETAEEWKQRWKVTYSRYVEEAKATMRGKRANQTEQEKEEEMEETKERKRMERKNKTEEEWENYCKIERIRKKKGILNLKPIVFITGFL